jgi:hypothetical protein
MASLEPGIRVVNAPHFHNTCAWSDRLRLNSGVELAGDGVLPRDDWRPPSPAELALLTAADVNQDDALALFSIPDRLHARWWSIAATQPAAAESGWPAFQEFAREVIEYLQFKRLPLPPACVCEVVVNAPGQSWMPPRGGGVTAGSLLNAVLGCINLSDEESALVFLNRAEPQKSAGLASATGADSLPSPAKALVAASGDYPLTRIALRPGEGYWLPHCQVVAGSDTRGRNEIDVQLVIRANS